MRRLSTRIILGLLLVAAGTLFLLQSLGVISEVGRGLWAAAFAVGGVAFLSVFLTERVNWWAIIPGFTLLGLAALIALEPLLGGATASLFLGSIGLAFLAIRLVKPDYWWAIVPAGAMLAVALVVGLAPWIQGAALGGAFLLGLALTFALLYLLPPPEQRFGWALIPAGVLGLLGVLLIAVSSEIFAYVWPVLLIVAGVILLIRLIRGG